MAGLLETINRSWASFFAKSTARQIVGSALVTAVASFVPRLAGFVRDIVIAAIFGISGEMDAYLMAFTLVGLPSSVFLGALQTVLIPELSHWDGSRQKHTENLFRAAISAGFIGMALLLMVLLALWPSMAKVVASGFTGERQAYVQKLLWWFIPYYFLSSVNLLGYAALQGRRLFIQNGFLPATVPLASVLMLLIVGQRIGILVLILGLTLGVAAEHVILSHVLARRAGMLLLPGWLSYDEENVRVIRAFVALLPGTVVLSLWPVVDQALASRLGEGAITALGYGYKLPALINGVLGTAIGIAALPYISELVSRRDWHSCTHVIGRMTQWLLLAFIPLAGVLVLFSSNLVEVLFKRGAFNAQAVEAVTPIQQTYLLQMPAVVIGIMLTRVQVALGRNVTLTLVALCSLLFYVPTAWCLSDWMGVAGLGLAAAATSAANAAVLYLLTRRELESNNRGKLV